MNRRPVAVPLILSLNIFVFFLWLLFGRPYENFMTENFLVSWTELVQGRIWTLVTSAFSHNMFLHLFINMYVFFGFGSVLEVALGFRSFVKFYLTAGIVASLSHSIVSATLLNEPDMPALGASGAICGVVIVFSLLFPREKILLLGLIPVPAVWGALLLVGLDLWGLIAQAKGHRLPIGYGAHLGGALTGAVYYFGFLRHRREIKGVLF